MSFLLQSVLITDEIDSQCVEILQKNGIQVVKNTKLSKEQLLTEIPKYDGLVVRSATKVTADVINAGTNLKIIGRAGTGVDNIDCDAATRRGIIVMNTPGGNTLSAAEHTCTLICALSRHIHRGDRAMKEEKWSERKVLMGNELYGKTLAIIGLGRIGKEVALRMQSFGMTTIGYDPIIPAEVSAEFNTEWMPLEKIWPLADYITVHTPLIPQTRNLINDQINAHAMTNALSPESRPWVELGRKLGQVAAGLNPGNVEHMQVTTYGPSLKQAGSYLSAGILSGLLQNSPALGGGDSPTLNLVNSPALAKQMGLDVKNTHEEAAPAPYTNVVSVIFNNGFRLSGTTSGGNALLIEVQGQQFSVPASLVDVALLFKGTGNPQLLPSVAGALASAGMCVSSLTVSVENDGQKWGVATFATPPTEKCLEVLKTIVNAAVLITEQNSVFVSIIEALRCGCKGHEIIIEALRCGCKGHEIIIEALRCGCKGHEIIIEALRCWCKGHEISIEALRCGCKGHTTST
ncbi:serA [Mytilus coruscus]|uniref:SerA n=1 Tax=Mytilus coruscus TaxID=42192 RepID=A0A6J8BD08_MYTCO|nr:unnamed protein product [Mytilus coruscus]CAC5381476.1 serA [Mytilus coruscus]